MSKPTVREFMDALGLRPGLDDGPITRLTDEEMQSACRIAGWLKSSPEDEKLSFYHELASTCLPSFLRTFFRHPFTYQPGMSVVNADQYLALSAYVDRLLRPDTSIVRHFHRFCRARPEEVVDFFHAHIKRLLQMDNDKFGPSMLERCEPDFVLCLVRITGSLMEELGLVIGSDRYWALVQGSSTTLTLATGPRLERLRRHLVEEVDRESYARAMVTLQVAISKSLAGFPKVPQWPVGIVCELTCSEKLRPSETCVEPEEGMELPECSRCRTVRYCSPGGTIPRVLHEFNPPSESDIFKLTKDPTRLPLTCASAHQKRDWKKHKPTCFAPGW